MFIGLDVHKDSIQIVSVKSPSSKIIDIRKIDSRIDTITEFVQIPTQSGT